MGNKARNERPTGLKPIRQIEVSEKNVKQRWILLIVFVAIAIGAFSYALSELLTTDPGWIEVEAKSSDISCGEDFIFSYYIGAGEHSPAAEKKQITALYGETAVRAYRLFNRDRHFDGVVNVYDLNSNPNTEMQVDPALYNAFSVLTEHESRHLYLGALCVEYETLFFGAESLPAAKDDDPYVNDEIAAYFEELAQFAADPASVELELLGDNRVCLRVSEEYLAFAEENGITDFIDFFRMKNAFVIDLIADSMIEKGFTHGCISSYDGYVRNLDNSGTMYSINLFDLQGDYVYNTARMDYQKPLSIITLRAYPLGEKDSLYFYTAPDGSIITPYPDIEDGLYKTATDSLISYSETQSCAEILLAVMPNFIRADWDGNAQNALTDDGIWSVWFEGSTLFYNESEASINELYSDEKVQYRKEYTSLTD